MSALTALFLAATAPAVFVLQPAPIPRAPVNPDLLQGSQYAKAETTKTALVDEAVLCRRRPVTGSLVRTTKECHTRSEWNRLDDDVRKQSGEYVDHGRGGTNGDGG